MNPARGIDSGQRAAWKRDGYFLIPGFCAPAVGEAMLHCTVELSRSANGAGVVDRAIVRAENNDLSERPAAINDWMPIDSPVSS